jgi:hypothetical protein
MSKKISLQILGFISALAILGATFGLPVLAQKTTPAVTPANTKSAAVAAATEEVLQETSLIRKLAVLRSVKSGAQSRAEIERMIIENLDEDTSPEEMHAAELTMKKLGLVPADFQYRPFVIGLLTEQVAGYYDPKAKQFYLADWIELDAQQPVIAHELTHALQDQHFNLRRFENWPKGDSDAELAAHALIEGDATFTMMQYISRDPERMKSFMKTMSATASANEKFDKAPRALRESLLFPYEKGLQFVMRLKGEGGWESVSQAFTELPKSSEQILHSEKYIANEAPLKVDFPDLSAALGRGWKRVDYDVNGEWSYYLILDEFLKSPERSEKASAGWGGDRYALYQGPVGEVLMVQLTVWDSEKDANEFFPAYVERSKLRYQTIEVEEMTATLDKPIRRATLHTKEGDVLISQSGNRVLIIEGASRSLNISELQSAILSQLNGRPTNGAGRR